MDIYQTTLLPNIRARETLQVQSCLILKLKHSIPHGIKRNFPYYLSFYCKRCHWSSLDIARKSQETQQLAILDIIQIEIRVLKDWIY